ncbi:MAG: HTH-type transcriptional regulatory protein GabR [Burkholderia plantarii]|nr:MAG: HTH-type transcriptional regulatory protein GabR [Burkholderia plantarii]
MARTPRSVDIPALGQLDRAAGQLCRQLAQALRDAIRRGDVRAGEPLPASRQLAQALGIARGTVIEAFEQLIAEGFLESRGRTGTWVARALSIPAGLDAAAPAARLPESAARFARIAADFSPLPSVPFAVSVPGGATLPDAAWRRLANRLRASGVAGPAGYGDPRGVSALREAIADYVRRSRSVRCEASQVIVTSGTQQGLYLACQVLLGQGDRAWVENPAYRGITAILESLGRGDAIVRVPVDADGIDVAAGRAAAREARAAFVTPSHQYPLGMPLSIGRRRALLDWAREHDAWVVEDDYDSELRYAGHPFPAMQGLDPARVVYLGTFSKILFPSLRLGYAIVPPSLVTAFLGARVLMDRHAPTLEQHVLAAFIAEGHLDRHIRRVRGVYAARREQLIAVLDAALPRDIAWREPSDQGMHLVLWLAARLDDRHVAALAAAAGVAVRPVSPMYASGTARPGLVLGFGGFETARMTAAAHTLASVILAAAQACPVARG